MFSADIVVDTGLLPGLSTAVLKVYESGIDLSGAAVGEVCFAPFF